VTPGVSVQIPFIGVQVGSPRMAIVEDGPPLLERRRLHPNSRGSKRSLEREFAAMKVAVGYLNEDTGISATAAPASAAPASAAPTGNPPVPQPPDAGPVLGDPVKIGPLLPENRERRQPASKRSAQAIASAAGQTRCLAAAPISLAESGPVRPVTVVRFITATGRGTSGFHRNSSGSQFAPLVRLEEGRNFLRSAGQSTVSHGATTAMIRLNRLLALAGMSGLLAAGNCLAQDNPNPELSSRLLPRRSPVIRPHRSKFRRVHSPSCPANYPLRLAGSADLSPRLAAPGTETRSDDS